jgi:hypothetical protein
MQIYPLEKLCNKGTAGVPSGSPGRYSQQNASGFSPCIANPTATAKDKTAEPHPSERLMITPEKPTLRDRFRPQEVPANLTQEDCDLLQSRHRATQDVSFSVP